MTEIDLVHDIQVFINLWRTEYNKMRIRSDRLILYYNIKPCYDYDEEYTYGFTCKGLNYAWDYGSEELYLNGDDSSDPITEGDAYDYACANAAITSDVYKSVEDEMSSRGWIWDNEDYGHDLYKDGWSTSLVYFAGYGDWDSMVGDWEYYGDE